MSVQAFIRHCPTFLITIDTEGGTLRTQSRGITCRSTGFRQRFWKLCERYGFMPTWLTTYEMAMDDTFVAFGRDVIQSRISEIGMHRHAWNSLPLQALTDDDFRYHPYLIKYPEPLMQETTRAMTDLLKERFGVKMRSLWFGRRAFNETYASLLLEHGYEMDYPVTPHISWRRNRGTPSMQNGLDYRHFPRAFYFLDTRDTFRADTSVIPLHSAGNAHGHPPQLPLPVGTSRLSPAGRKKADFARRAAAHSATFERVKPRRHAGTDARDRRGESRPSRIRTAFVGIHAEWQSGVLRRVIYRSAVYVSGDPARSDRQPLRGRKAQRAPRRLEGRRLIGQHRLLGWQAN